jgi:hypothetical protein
MHEDFTVLVHLEKPDEKVIIPADGPPARGDYPTSSWLPGVRFQDERLIQVPQNTPPGLYRVIIGFYRPVNLTRLPVDGNVTDYVVLSQLIEVLPAPGTVRPAIPD